MTYTIVTTADGTLSCHDSETGEWMHNRAGAYTEALKNYAEPSNAKEIAEQAGKITLLDGCYGLGYNTWVLVDHLLNTVSRPLTIRVIGIEKYLDVLKISPSIFEHPSFDNLKQKIPALEHNIYYRTFECVPDTKGEAKNFTFRADLKNGSRLELIVWLDDLRQRLPKLSEPVDLVFHDAFSAQKMPELWTVDVFREYHRLLQPKKGALLTYSAAAAIRAGLLEAGFQVGKTVPLGLKQGGTIAAFSLRGEALSGDEQAYLQSRAGIPYRDPHLLSTREEILTRRKAEQAQSGRPSGEAIRQGMRQKPYTQ